MFFVNLSILSIHNSLKVTYWKWRQWYLWRQIKGTYSDEKSQTNDTIKLKTTNKTLRQKLYHLERGNKSRHTHQGTRLKRSISTYKKNTQFSTCIYKQETQDKEIHYCSKTTITNNVNPKTKHIWQFNLFQSSAFPTTTSAKPFPWSIRTGPRRSFENGANQFCTLRTLPGFQLQSGR